MVHHTITSSFHFEHSLAPGQALPVTPELPTPAVLPGILITFTLQLGRLHLRGASGPCATQRFDSELSSSMEDARVCPFGLPPHTKGTLRLSPSPASGTVLVPA